MAKFTYDDIVRVRNDAPESLRPGARAWVIAVFKDSKARPGKHFGSFPEGAVYTVEFEDSSTSEVHESYLESDISS